VRLGRQHVRNGVISMARLTTNVSFNATVMPRLQAAIDALPHSKKHLTFLITAQGKPFTAAGCGDWFHDMCREAELPARCTSHGLRKAAAAYLAEVAATDHQLMAWFGWTSISQAQVYTKAANRMRVGHGRDFDPLLPPRQHDLKGRLIAAANVLLSGWAFRSGRPRRG